MLQNVAAEKKSQNVRVTKHLHHKALTTRRFLRFVTLTFWNDYVLKVLGLETYALKENICWSYVKWHKNCVMCGGSGMFIPDPGSSFLLISDPRSKNTSKRQLSEENGLLKHFLYSQICQNYALILDFICSPKNCAQFLPNYWIFYVKCHRALKKSFGSVIWDPGETYSGSRIPDPDPQHSLQYLTLLGYNI